MLLKVSQYYFLSYFLVQPIHDPIAASKREQEVVCLFLSCHVRRILNSGQDREEEPIRDTLERKLVVIKQHSYYPPPHLRSHYVIRIYLRSIL
jgi:hypothetical protein